MKGQKVLKLMPKKMQQTLKDNILSGRVKIVVSSMHKITEVYMNNTGDDEFWVDGLTSYKADSGEIVVYVSKSLYREGKEIFSKTLAHELTHAYQYLTKLDWVKNHYDDMYETNILELEAERTEKYVLRKLKGGAYGRN